MHTAYAVILIGAVTSIPNAEPSEDSCLIVKADDDGDEGDDMW